MPLQYCVHLFVHPACMCVPANFHTQRTYLDFDPVLCRICWLLQVLQQLAQTTTACRQQQANTCTPPQAAEQQYSLDDMPQARSALQR